MMLVIVVVIVSLSFRDMVSGYYHYCPARWIHGDYYQFSLIVVYTSQQAGFAKRLVE
jgi:hypothetical protein